MAFSGREPAAAYAALAAGIEHVEQEGVTERVLVMFLADGIESLVGLGQLDRAERLIGMLEQAARRLRRGWALAQAGRCRALLHAARGDLGAAALAASDACRGAKRLEVRLEKPRNPPGAGGGGARPRRGGAPA